MAKANMDIRLKAKNNKISLWQIADTLNISEWTLIRRLRKELSAEEKERIFDIIERLKNA